MTTPVTDTSSHRGSLHRAMVTCRSNCEDDRKDWFNELKTAIATRLNFANEYSLRRRPRSLFVEHGDVLALLVPKPAGYISPIVDTGNDKQ